MNGYLAALNRRYHRIKPAPDRRLEQYAIDVTGVLSRARFIARSVRHGEGLVVGDDDLVSLYLAGFDQLALTVLEKDERVIRAIEDNLPEDAAVEVVPTDLQGVYDGEWPLEGRSFDFFVASPPYTPEGMSIFVAIGLRRLRVGGLGFIASPHDTNPRAEETTLHAQRFLLENGALIEEVLPAFTCEEGLPAYQIVARKLRDVERFDWLRPMKRTMYEYEEYKCEDAYDHQIDRE